MKEIEQIEILKAKNDPSSNSKLWEILSNKIQKSIELQQINSLDL